MTTFAPRIDDVLEKLDKFLALFQAMVNQQQTIVAKRANAAADAALLKQMLHAQNVVENRRHDLRKSIGGHDAVRFVHELWSLAGDMAHFDFDTSRLADHDAFESMRQQISNESLPLTRDLSTNASQQALLAELALRR